MAAGNSHILIYIVFVTQANWFQLDGNKRNKEAHVVQVPSNFDSAVRCTRFASFVAWYNSISAAWNTLSCLQSLLLAVFHWGQFIQIKFLLTLDNQSALVVRDSSLSRWALNQSEHWIADKVGLRFLQVFSSWIKCPCFWYLYCPTGYMAEHNPHISPYPRCYLI